MEAVAQTHTQQHPDTAVRAVRAVQQGGADEAPPGTRMHPRRQQWVACAADGTLLCPPVPPSLADRGTKAAPRSLQRASARAAVRAAYHAFAQSPRGRAALAGARAACSAAVAGAEQACTADLEQRLAAAQDPAVQAHLSKVAAACVEPYTWALHVSLLPLGGGGGGGRSSKADRVRRATVHHYVVGSTPLYAPQRVGAQGGRPALRATRVVHRSKAAAPHSAEAQLLSRPVQLHLEAAWTRVRGGGR